MIFRYVILGLLAALILAVSWVWAGRLNPATEVDESEIMAAIRVLERAVELRPENHEAYHHLSRAYHLAGRSQDAELLYRRAIELHPQASWPRIGLGQLLLATQRFEEAVSELDAAIENAATKSSIYVDVLAAYERYPALSSAAEKTCLIFAENLPRDARPHRELARIYRQRGDHSLALAAAENVYELARNPRERAMALHEQGLARQAMEQLPAAEELYTRAIEIAPGVPILRLTLGQLMRQQGRLDEAVDQMRQAVVLQPQVAWSRLQLGGILMVSGNVDEGLLELERALLLEPSSPVIQRKAGELKLAFESAAAALPHFEKAAALDPANVLAKLGLARAHRRLQDLDRALELAREAVELASDEAAYDAAVAELGLIVEARVASQGPIATPPPAGT